MIHQECQPPWPPFFLALAESQQTSCHWMSLNPTLPVRPLSQRGTTRLHHRPSTVLLLFQHTFIPISMWRLIISPRVGCFQSGIFSLRYLKWLLPLGPTKGGSTGILPYNSMPALLHLGKTTTSEGLGVECLQPSLDISDKL